MLDHPNYCQKDQNVSPATNPNTMELISSYIIIQMNYDIYVPHLAETKKKICGWCMEIFLCKARKGINTM